MGGAAGWYCAQPQQLFTTARSAKLVSANAPVELLDVRVSQFASLSSGELKSQLEALLVSPVRDSEKLQALMFRWVVTDLESAKAWVRVWPDDKSKWADSSSQPVRDFFKAWAGIDPAAAMAEALAIGGEKTITAQDAVITGLARADFQTIKDVLSNTPDGKNNPRNAVAELMKQLVARDRTAALELAMSLKGAMGDGAVAGISEVWARTDPKSALAWAEQHPEAAIRDNAAKIILMQCARQDPESVGPMLIQKKEGLPDVFRTEVADEAVARLSESSPQEAAAFVAKYYPQDRLKANLGSLFFRLMDEGAGNPRGGSDVRLCKSPAGGGAKRYKIVGKVMDVRPQA